MTKEKKLTRSEKDRYLGGVAGGLAEYFEIDASLIRLAFILLFVFGGSGLFLYLLAWIFIPASSNENLSAQDNIKKSTAEIKAKANDLASEIEDMSHRPQSKRWLGLLIIFVGVLFLLNNLDFFSFPLWRFWPIVLIFLGIKTLLK